MFSAALKNRRTSRRTGVLAAVVLAVSVGVFSGQTLVANAAEDDPIPVPRFDDPPPVAVDPPRTISNCSPLRPETVPAGKVCIADPGAGLTGTLMNDWRNRPAPVAAEPVPIPEPQTKSAPPVQPRTPAPRAEETPPPRSGSGGQPSPPVEEAGSDEAPPTQHGSPDSSDLDDSDQSGQPPPP